MRELTKELNWDIREERLYTNDQSEVFGYKAIMREDTQETLSVMKTSYSPLTNSEFIEKTQKLSEISGFEVTGYNDFKGGRKVLSFLKNNRGNVDIGGNKMEDYMVIGNSHDGSSSFFVGISSVLIRCESQFSRISNLMKVRHTKNFDAAMEEAYRYFDYYLNLREKMLTSFNRFNSAEINGSTQEELVNFVLEVEKNKEISTRKQNQIDLLNQNIAREKQDLGNTLWALFNGVTRYTTHEISPKEQTFGNMFGTQGKINEKAFDFCEACIA